MLFSIVRVKTDIKSGSMELFWSVCTPLSLLMRGSDLKQFCAAAERPAFRRE